MAETRPKPRIHYDTATSYDSKEEEPKSMFGFDIRWQDEERWNAWASDGLRTSRITAIGCVGSVDQTGEFLEPGIRGLAFIAHLAQEAEKLRKIGLDEPQIDIFYPAAINALANSGDTRKNQRYAVAYHRLIEGYFQTFHPNLSRPHALFDNPQGIPHIQETARQILTNVSHKTMSALMGMATKYNLTDERPPKEIQQGAIEYLLAHYFAYGRAVNTDYINLGISRRLFIAPQSEMRFQNLMDDEHEIISHHIPIVGLTEDGSGNTIIGYSISFTSAPYYRHRNEPSILTVDRQLPTSSQYSRHGIPGLVLEEIKSSIALLQEDTGGNIDRLHENVINPFKQRLARLESMY